MNPDQCAPISFNIFRDDSGHFNMFLGYCICYFTDVVDFFFIFD